MGWKERAIKRSDTERREERVKEVRKWARWLPDSGYQSHFGKPAFHCYGRDNTTPIYGGHVYGDYLLSHNVNPEHGQNLPKYQQVYKAAMSHGFTHGDRVPTLSRKGQANLEITPSALKELMQRNPIMPKKFNEPSNEDDYTDGSDNEWDFSHLEKKNKKNRNKLNFHPKEEENDKTKEGKDLEAEGDAEEGESEKEENDSNEYPAVNPHPEERESQSATPEVGSLEYKRMLEKFLSNPEYVKTLMREGGDLQDIFPFCSTHNSYGQQLPTHELDPRNYKFLPSKYVKRITPAGKQTNK